MDSIGSTISGLSGSLRTRTYDPRVFSDVHPSRTMDRVFSDLEHDNPGRTGELQTIRRRLAASIPSSQSVPDLLRSIQDILLILQNREEEFFMLYVEVQNLLCNLRCKYCWLTHDNRGTYRRGNLLVSHTNATEKGQHQEQMDTPDRVAERVDRILANNQLSTKAGILKVAGGEILMLPEVIAILHKREHIFRKIQILTNGTLLGKYDLDGFDPQKYMFQVSLDGHDQEMNRQRQLSSRSVRTIIDRLKKLRAKGFNVEINTVLTDANMEQLPAFAEYLHKESPGTTIAPFPVRGHEGFLTKATSGILRTLADDLSRYDSTLPPRAYFDALIANLEHGIRRNTCHLPLLIGQSTDEGDVASCPCRTIKVRGNILRETVPPILPESDEYRQIAGLQHAECRTCFTHFDVINLFMDGLISDEEMRRVGMFQDPVVFDVLKSLKRKMKKSFHDML